MDYAKSGKIENDAVVMINITGGGEDRYKSQHKVTYLKPSVVFDIDPDMETLKGELDKLF